MATTFVAVVVFMLAVAVLEVEVEFPALRKLAKLENVREMLGSDFFLRPPRAGDAEVLPGMVLPEAAEYVDDSVLFR